MPSQPDIVAAGAVVLRSGGEVLLVHRPKYDDWSFPKGKLDRGEHATAAAVREVAEETGLLIRLCAPLLDQRYPASGRQKTVHYWIGRVVGSDDTGAYQPNHEIDQVRWVGHAEARRLLTYRHDRRTLREARRLSRKTTALVVVRHAKARSRSHWHADDRFRPLLKLGSVQADRLVPVLAAYDVRRLVTSSSVRCVATISPYADTCGRKIETEDRLSEEDATPESIAAIVKELVAAGKRTVLCTHRPVLPGVFAALGIDDRQLEPGALVVVHHKRGRVVAVEEHPAR